MRTITGISLMVLMALTACGGEKNPSTGEAPTQNPQTNQPQTNVPQTPVSQNTTINPVLQNPQLVTFRQDVPVAVLDSGVDASHPTLSQQMWLNALETVNNQRDDDMNNYVDDITGWNFIENNNSTFDNQSFQQIPSTDVVQFMHYHALLGLGQTLSNDQTNWFNQRASDTNYLNQVSIYSTLSHGTHVSGIITKDSPRARIIPVKVLATGSNEAVSAALSRFFIRNVVGGVGGTTTGVGDAVRYAAQRGALVANGSFSLSYEDIRNAISQTAGFLNSSVIDQLVSSAITQITNTLSREISQATNTLFIFAAGNETADNDASQRLPANVRQPNTLTIAATNGRASLATFSNFGATRVDVAAPGVGIVSTVPGNQTVEMSGTSMAAPYVARVAAQIRAINPRLTVIETRRILLETVDVKEFLRGRVATSGIVNPVRARVVAELSLTVGLDSAIQQARASVADLVTE